MLFALICFAIIFSQVKERRDVLNKFGHREDFEKNFNPDDIKDVVKEFFGTTADFIDDFASEASYRAGNFSERTNANSNLAAATLAKIAICYYIARADGTISREEQLVLDGALSSVLNDPDIPQYFRDELNNIANDSSNSFLNVEKYLNRVNPEILASFLEDAEKIAGADRRLSMDEQEAIKVFKKYLAGKTGRSFNDDLKTISTRCEGCGATMKFTVEDSKITCPYCGQVKMLKL